MPVRRLLAVAFVLALALPGCAPRAQAPAPARAGQPKPPASGTGLEAQASWLKGSQAKLTPIAGARRWLRSPGLEAYRDADGAELVYDRKRDAVLSWERSIRTVSDTSDTWQAKGYGVAVGVAAKQADVKAREVRKGDLAAMRRTVQLVDKGNGPEYEFQYDRYVDGVRAPDHVTVDCSGLTGAPGFTAFFTKPSAAAKGFRPKLTLAEAARKSASAFGLEQWRFVSAELYLEPMAGAVKPKVVWAIQVENTQTPPKGSVPVEGNLRLAVVDPLTGEVTQTQ